MIRIQIASLSLKLIGIFSIIQAIPILKELSAAFAFKKSNLFISEAAPPTFNYLLLGILTSIILLLILGTCLIIFSDKLAEKIMKGNSETLLTDISARDIQLIAFSVVGVVLIVLAIPQIVQLGVNIQVLKQAGDDLPIKNVLASTWAHAIGLTIQTIIGLLLFFGSRGLSSLWYSFQSTRPMKNI
ncbi:MAG: hypothetical protein HY753_07840 [Nitrospirae bacterium]|nr:hypothetical protein [Nitrospirota bacterium]